MPQTLEEWRYLAELYGIGLEEAREEINRLKQKVNKLEQAQKKRTR